jgi:hypothetical protein
MNYRASQIVHDAREVCAGRKSYPSSQLRFKAENGRALDGGDIYLRDEKRPSYRSAIHDRGTPGGRLLEEVGEF